MSSSGAEKHARNLCIFGQTRVGTGTCPAIHEATFLEVAQRPSHRRTGRLKLFDELGLGGEARAFGRFGYIFSKRPAYQEL